jgi:hypothetical protein
LFLDFLYFLCHNVLTMTNVTEVLASRTQAGHGAIQVESADQRGLEPLMIMVGGPIKWWWQGDNWDSPLHRHYVAARNRIRDELIAAGYCTYFPNEAIKRSWTERAQLINDGAIRASDVFVQLYVPDVVAEGTAAEAQVAREAGVAVHLVWVEEDRFNEEVAFLLKTLENHQNTK